MKKYLIPVLTASFLLASCNTPSSTSQPLITPPTKEIVTVPAQEKLPTQNTVGKNITVQEVSQHSTKNDCWLILDGGVYNVTSFIPSHPGGDKILRGCGKDATEMFARHPDSAKALKEQFKIGNLAQ